MVFTKNNFMKKIISFSLVLFLSLLVSNQLGAQSFSGIATYDMKLAEDVFYFDGTLMLTNKESFFSFKKNKKQKWIRENEDESQLQIILTDTIGHFVYRKSTKSELIIRDFCEKSKPLFYKDSISFNWTIGSKEKVIQGVNCKNAFTTFRGRDYEAWFSPEIPINAGPWKFFGLPGLIIQITDKKGEVFILLKSLNLKKDSLHFDKKQLLGNYISKKKFNDCLDVEWTKYYKKNRANIARLQAEFPELEITDNNLSKKRKATELE